MALASAQLAIGSLSNAAIATVYTGLSGHRTIVKCLALRNAGAAGAIAVTIVPTVGNASTFNVWCAASGNSGDSTIVLPWIVLNAGDLLRLTYPTASGGWYHISGAQLAT